MAIFGVCKSCGDMLAKVLNESEVGTAHVGVYHV